MTRAAPASGVSIRILLLLLFALFAMGNVLVPVFLGRPGVAAASALAACIFLALLWRSERSRVAPRLAWRTLGICLGVACLLLVLGGEGRLLYANEDWQVRDAVLADMARNPWPFAYLTDGGARILRAPLGMYLLPALFGAGAQPALLACNTLVLGLLLALAATLFPSSRARAIALGIFLAFSGLDIIGTLIANASGTASFDHLERWAPPLQYSSVLTLILWVPQHAFAGWLCALLYLLHRRGSVAAGTLAASVPIAAIWSPLAVIGALPFIAWAGLRALRDNALQWRDVALGVTALTLSLPALAYLAADAQQVPSGIRGLPLLTLAIFLLLEVGPLLWIVQRLRGARHFGIDTLLLTAGILAILPFFYLGEGADLVMRASIAPLVILCATLVASLVHADCRTQRTTILIAALVLALAAVTGLAEIARALRYAPAPSPQCSLPRVWQQQTGWIADISTYLARAEAMPDLLRAPPVRTLDTRGASPACWSRTWKTLR